MGRFLTMVLCQLKFLRSSLSACEGTLPTRRHRLLFSQLAAKISACISGTWSCILWAARWPRASADMWNTLWIKLQLVMTNHPVSIKLIAAILVALHVTKYVLTGKYIVGEGVGRGRGKRGEMDGRKGREFYRVRSGNITCGPQAITFFHLSIFVTCGVEVCAFASAGILGRL